MLSASTSRHLPGHQKQEGLSCKALSPHWPRSAAPVPRLQNNTLSRSAKSRPTASIRDFIANESPVKGFDGNYRERTKESTIEAALIGLDDISRIVIPGMEAVMKVDQPMLEHVLEDQGQVLLAVMAPGELPTCLLPPKGAGSYAILAQVLGVQRLPGDGGGFIRFRAQHRVLVQAIQALGNGGGSLRAQAAMLPDRWAYYVRSAAVEEVLQGASLQQAGSDALEALNLNGQPADVRTAIVSLQDVGEEMVSDLVEALDVLRSLHAINQGNPKEEAIAEALDEMERLLEWCLQNADGSGVRSGQVISLAALEKLSYAPASFGFDSLGSLAGVLAEEIQGMRVKAMESSDVGMRLESVANLAHTLTSRVKARAALEGMS